MIKIEADGERLKILARGDAVSLAADVAYAISGIYENFVRSGRRSDAAVFRAAVIPAVAAPDSPVWELGSSKDASGVFVCMPDMRGRKEDGHAES